MMELESRNQTIRTYVESADELAEYFESIGSRSGDIDKAIELWGDRLPVVIEIGCGAGRDAVDILSRTPYYAGFDISPRMIDLAHEKVRGGHFFVGDLRYLPFDGNWLPSSADIIFAFASLLHSDEEEIERVLQNSLDILNPGGIFYISLKAGEGQVVKEDHFGRRTFYLYRPEDIERLAGSTFETVYKDHQIIGSTDWFTIALKKK